MSAFPRLADIEKAHDETMRSGDILHLAALLLRADGDLVTANLFAEEGRRVPERVVSFMKAAVAAGSTDPASWGSELAGTYASSASAFLAAQRSFGIFDAALPAMRQVPLRTRIVSVTAVPSASSIAQGAAKPLSRFSLSSTTLAERKTSAFVIISNELARFSADGALPFINGELRRALAAVTDAVFLSELASASATPVAASGSTAAAIYGDLSLMLDTINATAESAPYLVIHSSAARYLATLNDTLGHRVFPEISIQGGTLAGVPVIVSDAIASYEIVLFDASRIAANGGTVIMDSARAASVQMDDSPAAGASSLVSMFQTDSVALRAERWFGFEALGGSVATTGYPGWVPM